MSAGDAIISPKMAAAGQRAEDGVPDMTSISDIDVGGVNTNLRVRFGRDEIYTFTGTILVAVNPYQFLPIYEKDTMMLYNGRRMGDLPPHIFATAEAAYLNVQRSEQNQSCVISGESGAGKTECTKFILQYLCSVTSTVSNWVEQQIMECNTILEAFGNAKTVRNDNSSRFGKFMQVCFDKKVEIKGMIVQEYLLEQSRITCQTVTERNYHVFYQILKGADPKKYLLDSMDTYKYINTTGCYELERIDDRQEFEKLCMALTVLNIEEDIQDGVYSLVSAVLCIGNLNFQSEDGGEKCSLDANDEKMAGKISKLLDIDLAGTRQVLTNRTIVVKGEGTVIPLKKHEADQNKHAIAKALYSRTFTWLVDQINQTTNPGASTAKFIGVLDIFGFENFEVNGFEQLCINFTNEKLHKFFNHYVFALEQAEYKKEEIDFSHITFTDNSICLELIEKPPICVLKLLDEECKVPKGSDVGYVMKQHAGLGKHPCYIKPHEMSLEVEFGIKHFAGPVIYTVDGFLSKNKDADQGALFELMRNSSNKFIKDVTRFQDMLNVERSMIAGAKAGKSEKGGKSGGRKKSIAMTNKAKPTVGDTFRRQLGQLVDILDTTTPWYVRCVKPNGSKKPQLYEDELCTTQLNYSGMLDIIRIRREGFPVHVPAETFVEKYQALAQFTGKLDENPRTAAVQILEYIKAPKTEWQLGKTKIFLRDSVFEPLEEKLRVLLEDKVLMIQKNFRKFRAQKAYVEKRLSVMKIQASVTGAIARLGFLQKRRCAIKIQATWRGFLAREMYKAMKIKFQKEMAERRRKEEERRKKELQEKGEKIMEDNFMAAQKELFAMAKVAEIKASNLNKKRSEGQSGASNLDAMFTYLADDQVAAGDESMMEQVDAEMDRMFADPKATSSVQKDGTRTMRRKKRVEKTTAAHEAAHGSVPVGGSKVDDDVDVDPAEYSILKFAEKYFNNHPKAGSGTLSRKNTAKRRQQLQAIEDPMDKSQMCVYSKSPILATSMIRMHNPENVNYAVTIFKDLHRQMTGSLKTEVAIKNVQSIIAYCIERNELRDEVLCQLMRQVNNNPDPESQLRGWHILCVCVVSIPPTKILYPYLKSFIKINQRDQVVGPYADWALEALKKVRMTGCRRVSPSQVEIEAIRAHQPIICRFYFLDGKAKAVGVQPSWTAADVIAAVAGKIHLQSTAGWALFESTPQSEKYIRNHEYVGDILSEWEAAKRDSMQMSKYTTMSRKGATQAIGGGDAKFVFRKRLFLNPREISTDPMEYSLVYAQAVHAVVRGDEFPVTEKVALQLAGLQAQVLWGDANPEYLSRYEDVASYLPIRILAMRQTTTKEQWMQKIFLAHKEYGVGMTDTRAMVVYLTAAKQYPHYGGTNFEVAYKGFWSFPNKLYLSVHSDGFKFVATREKEILAEYPYTALKNVEVNSFESSITLNMVPGSLGDTASFTFHCARKNDVANLIASYSPKHGKWKQVGEAAVNKRKVTIQEKAKYEAELAAARAALTRSGLLLKPKASKSFVPTTLRRRLSKSSAADAGGAEGFDKRYWSYEKRALSQPLTNMSTEETEEIAQMTFQSLLVFAWLAREGGYAEPDDTGHVSLVQSVIHRCLEKEDVCNEFYLQLIKQTTDQPDPDGKVNLQNWRFMALILGVVVPRNTAILGMINTHLKLYSSDPDTEEGKFAQFCRQCMLRTIENKNRKYPPSKQEIGCVTRRSQVYARFYFMDGEFRALMFDSAATTAEVVAMIKDRIGLPASVDGFSLFEVFGALERNMLPWEKVPDAIFKWEKYAKNTRAVKELRLTFKKRLFLGPYEIPKSPVEFDLTFYQALEDVRADVFPITVEEGCQIVALRAQVEFGDWTGSGAVAYDSVIDKYIPKYMRTAIDSEEVSQHHLKLKGIAPNECNVLFMKFVMSWPLYGSTVFEVLQSYTTTLPKTLWLAVNEHGIHLLRRRTKEPLISYAYKSIVNYSPSLKNLMIVTESLTRGTKFVFNTSQASQIAHLIKDYTHIIIQRTTGGGMQTPEKKPAAAPPKARPQGNFGSSGQRGSIVSINSVISNSDDEDIRGFEDVDPGADQNEGFKRKMSGEFGFGGAIDSKTPEKDQEEDSYAF